MKLYVDYKNTDDYTDLGFTLYSKNGVILYSDVQKVKRLENKMLPVIKSMIFALTRLQQLLDNGKIPHEKVTIFIKNQVVFNWFITNLPNKEYREYFDEVMFRIDWVAVDLELINTQNIRGKVKFNKTIEEERTYSIFDID